MLKLGLFARISIVLALVLGLIGSLPSLLPSGAVKSVLGDAADYLQPITLGLDLRGGAHLLLELDEAGLREDLASRTEESVRLIMREAKIGFSSISLSGDTLRLVLRESSDVDRATREAINGIADFQISSEGNAVLLVMSELAVNNARQRAVEQSLEIIRRRVDETGAREPIIQIAGLGRVLVQMPGEQDPERLKRLLGKTAKLTFHLVEEGASNARAALSPGTERVDSSEKNPNGEPAFSLVVNRRVLLGGEHLVDANPTVDSSGLSIVQFRFDTYGAQTFGRITQNNVGRRLAILLDKEVISAPVIRSPILGGSGVIEGGNMDIVAARDLAVLMRAGSLPVPLNIVEERTVGAGLGADSITSATYAAILAFFLVAGYMIVVYRWFGLFASLSLVFNGLLILAALSYVGATLTLPGLGGIILTAGMAVDSNVLIFERMRDEALHEKKLINAIESGYSKAFSTIFDSNLTTLFAGIVLFTLGSGPIRGFAITLSIGILTSVFTALLPTRWQIAVWFRSRARSETQTLPF